MAEPQDFIATSTLSGLGTFALGTTPPNTTGIYFVNGQITIPTIPGGATANSQVTANLFAGATQLTTGVAGATGFQTITSTLYGNTALTVTLASAAAVDQGTNVIKGVVSVGLAV